MDDLLDGGCLASLTMALVFKSRNAWSTRSVSAQRGPGLFPLPVPLVRTR